MEEGECMLCTAIAVIISGQFTNLISSPGFFCVGTVVHSCHLGYCLLLLLPAAAAAAVIREERKYFFMATPAGKQVGKQAGRKTFQRPVKKTSNRFLFHSRTML
jgi:hypothetical protein